MTDTVSIKVPFPGLYETLLSSELDYVEEREAEWMAEAQDGQGGEIIPEELRLTSDKFAELLFQHSDYGAAHQAIARDYCAQFEEIASEDLGFALGLTFEEMTSPKFYNFETDRLFARIPVASIAKLFEISAADGHKALAGILEERHTSRSGFHSYYSNELEEWLEKPLEDWDHNELESLLLACLTLKAEDEEEITRRVSMAMIEEGGGARE